MFALKNFIVPLKSTGISEHCPRSWSFHWCFIMICFLIDEKQGTELYKIKQLAPKENNQFCTSFAKKRKKNSCFPCIVCLTLILTNDSTGGREGTLGWVIMFLFAQTEVTFKTNFLYDLILRYHYVIVAIKSDVQKANISNPCKIFISFYSFIRLKGEKAILADGSRESTIWKWQYVAWINDKVPEVLYLWYIVSHLPEMAPERSSHKGTGQRGAQGVDGRFSITPSYCGSFDFIMQRVHCDLRPLKFWLIMFYLCTPSWAPH